MKHYAVVGFGCAGYHAACAMREAGFPGEIHIFHQESDPPANPMLTTYYAGGKIPRQGMFPFGTLREIQKSLGLHLHMGIAVKEIDYPARRLRLADDSIFAYDKLLLATGAQALVPPFPGHSHPAVHCMRTPAHAERLRQMLASASIQKAVVIGASMVGIKVAELLLDHGAAVTLADLAPGIFSAAAMPHTARDIEARIREKGMTLKFGCGIAGVAGQADAPVVQYADGGAEPCDMMVLAMGTRAVTVLAGGCLPVRRGILVNTRMETAVAGIYAAGDCAEGRNRQSGANQIIGLWANAALQGRCAGRNMAGRVDFFEGNIPHNITHFLGMDFLAFGDNTKAGSSLVWKSRTGAPALEALHQNGKICCLNILDDCKGGGVLKAWFLRRLANGGPRFSQTERVRLLEQGFPPHLLSKLENLEIIETGGERRGVYH